MRVAIDGIGVIAAGWRNWRDALVVLREEATYDAGAVTKPVPELLPAAERRRASEAVRWTQTPALEALTQAGLSPEATAAVFASSSGNPEVVHDICEALARPERAVSPTRFHNSVHNTAAGYWAIATGCREASTSVGCYDGSFAAGLLEAATQAVVEARPVLLVAYDLPYPEPLFRVRPIAPPFAVAFVLQPQESVATLAALSLEMVSDSLRDEAMEQPALETLRSDNPAARALPLLRAIARGQRAKLSLEYLPRASLALEVAPC